MPCDAACGGVLGAAAPADGADAGGAGGVAAGGCAGVAGGCVFFCGAGWAAGPEGAVSASTMLCAAIVAAGAPAAAWPAQTPSAMPSSSATPPPLARWPACRGNRAYAGNCMAFLLYKHLRDGCLRGPQIPRNAKFRFCIRDRAMHDPKRLTRYPLLFSLTLRSSAGEEQSNRSPLGRTVEMRKATHSASRCCIAMRQYFASQRSRAKRHVASAVPLKITTCPPRHFIRRQIGALRTESIC